MEPKPKHLPTFVFKARWRATSVGLKVEAPNYDTALAKANSQIMKMEGGSGIISLDFIEERPW